MLEKELDDALSSTTMRVSELGGLPRDQSHPVAVKAASSSTSSPSNGLYIAANRVATSAVEADNTGDYVKAFSLYSVAVELYFEEMKCAVIAMNTPSSP